MKTIPLRRLLREPGQVKRWTRAGETVVITDAKEPLWVVRAAGSVESDPSRDRAIDEILEQALCAPRSPVNAARILEESRR
ncbi:MAG: hypothetical protein IT581_16165 [Verrucomicrobiales bacterium]|nr:hypothetical protein [Verrucomicrobiales bacterium]